MGTLWTYNAESDCEIDVSYKLSGSKGIAKLVLISPDGTLTTIEEANDKAEQNEFTTAALALSKGENRIKLVADIKCLNQNGLL